MRDEYYELEPFYEKKENMFFLTELSPDGTPRHPLMGYLFKPVHLPFEPEEYLGIPVTLNMSLDTEYLRINRAVYPISTWTSKCTQDHIVTYDFGATAKRYIDVRFMLNDNVHCRVDGKVLHSPYPLNFLIMDTAMSQRRALWLFFQHPKFRKMGDWSKNFVDVSWTCYNATHVYRNVCQRFKFLTDPIIIVDPINAIPIYFPTEYPLAGDFDEMTLLGQLPRTYKSIYFVEPYFAFQRPKVSFTASKTDSSHALKDLFSHLLPWG